MAAKPTEIKFAFYTTKAPTGLTIARDDNKFSCAWKIGDADYDMGQAFQYSINGGTWTAVKVKTRDTAASFSVDFSKFKPTTGEALNSIAFRVQGRRNAFSTTVEKKKKFVKTEYGTLDSDWRTKQYNFTNPSNPAVSAAWSEEYENRTTFSVSEATPTDAGNVSRQVIWQSMLVPNCGVTDGSKLTWASSKQGWQTGTMGASGGSKDIDEGAIISGTGTYTRWFRAMAKGVKGDSTWVYARHVYAAPNPGSISSVNTSRGSQSCLVTVRWTAAESVARPIDSVTVQYVIGTPTATGGAPTTGWQDAATLKDTSKADGVSISIPDVAGEDEALFVRVTTKHDNRVTYGAAARAAVGYVAAPSDLSATISGQTATIDCENNSEIPGSFTLISAMYKSGSKTVTVPLVILPKGTTRATGVALPLVSAGSEITFKAQTFAGSYTGGTTKYTAFMSSSAITYGTSIPAAPTGLALQATSTPEIARATWNWTWSAANICELSWTDHEDAWESTDEPSTYEIDRKVTAWNIAGLDAGVRWYVRVRLGLQIDDDVTWSDWTKTEEIVLSSAPVVPVLELSAGVITASGTVEASWVYVTSDGTSQASATIAEIVNGQYITIGSVTTAQNYTISASRQGWATGSTHQIAVRVVSGSGKLSDDWSAPVPLIIADAVTAEITQISLVDVTEDGNTFKALTEMPLTLTVTGAKVGGVTSVVIERAANYFIDRPDESQSSGYEGEAVAVYSQIGEAQITINRDDLIGVLDDGAAYRIIATTQDSYGQTATDTQDFRVAWTDQAVIPSGAVSIEETANGDSYAVIVPMADAAEDATCDIYRLSVDKPVLIYSGAAFGDFYVDPYPTIGEFGGHRIVYRTADGDYITEDNTLAWADLGEADGDYLDVDYNTVQWEGGRIQFEHNIDLSHTWTKDFTETQYLGGSVQGDWNPAVSRTGDASTVAVDTDDVDLIQVMRRLATFAGICHVRTKDGSSYAADVQVSENQNQNSAHKLREFSLKITRVDTQTLDGVTLAEWEQTHEPNPDDYATNNTPYLFRRTGGTIYGD